MLPSPPNSLDINLIKQQWHVLEKQDSSVDVPFVSYRS